MTDDIEQLAWQFSEYFKDTMEAEKDYFSIENQKIKKAIIDYHQERYKEKKAKYDSLKYGDSPKSQRRLRSPQEVAELNLSDEALYPTAEYYPELSSTLNERKHPFQGWLDSQVNYNFCIKTFRKKSIFYPLNSKYSKKEFSPIGIEAVLDNLIANAILRWKEIHEKGIEYYLKVNRNHVSKIIKKAEELLSLIDGSPEILKNNIAPVSYMGIRKLANGVGRSPAKLDISHLHPGDRKYIPKRDHAWADREFILRWLTDEYQNLFGRWQLVTIGDRNKEDFTSSLCRDFAEHDHLYDQEENRDKVWVYREHPIIHADVISHFLTLLDESFLDLDTRKIQEWAKKQRDRIQKAHRVMSK